MSLRPYLCFNQTKINRKNSLFPLQWWVCSITLNAFDKMALCEITRQSRL